MNMKVGDGDGENYFQLIKKNPFEINYLKIYEYAEKLRENYSKNDTFPKAVLIKALPLDVWTRVDGFVEIGTPENAQAVFEHFAGSGVNIFSQKRGWGRVYSIDDMPFSYKEGGLFVSTKPVMPW